MNKKLEKLPSDSAHYPQRPLSVRRKRDLNKSENQRPRKMRSNQN